MDGRKKGWSPKDCPRMIVDSALLYESQNVGSPSKAESAN